MAKQKEGRKDVCKRLGKSKGSRGEGGKDHTKGKSGEKKGTARWWGGAKGGKSGRDFGGTEHAFIRVIILQKKGVREQETGRERFRNLVPQRGVRGEPSKEIRGGDESSQA